MMMKMILQFVDSHCHLDFPEFDHDRDVVVNAAEKAGVIGFVVPGVTRAQWPRLKQLAVEYKHWQLAFGLHPYFIAEHVPADLMHLERLLRETPYAAVGETGLDASCGQPALQLYLLRAQLKLAAELQRPVILHHRKTLDILLEEVKLTQKKKALLGVVHAFSGSIEQANAWAEIGFKLGVGGVITYSRANKTRAAIRQASLTSLVLETDSPDMPLKGFQGQRNEPARVRLVFEALCELRCESPAEVAAQLLKNTQSIFPKISI